MLCVGIRLHACLPGVGVLEEQAMKLNKHGQQALNCTAVLLQQAAEQRGRAGCAAAASRGSRPRTDCQGGANRTADKTKPTGRKTGGGSRVAKGEVGGRTAANAALGGFQKIDEVASGADGH